MKCTERNFITRVLTMCHVKLTQIIAMEQNRFDLRSLLPTLPNLWLLLVTIIIVLAKLTTQTNMVCYHEFAIQFNACFSSIQFNTDTGFKA